MFTRRNADKDNRAEVVDRAMTDTEKVTFRSLPWPARGRTAWAITGRRTIRVLFWNHDKPTAIEGTPRAVWTTYRIARRARA